MPRTSPRFFMPIQAAIYRFGPYELRVRTRELYKQGTKLKLRPQPLHVLSVLAVRAGDVVTREEFHRLLWSAETFVDFEHGLNTAIKELRGVLSDSASQPRYIETLTKLGYRMIAPVTVEEEEPPSLGAVAPPQTASTQRLASEKSVPVGFLPALAVRRWPLLLGVSIILIAALGLYGPWSRWRERPRATSSRPMLAVLPFENLTGDPTQEYFSDGLTEEMIAQLGRLDPEHLGVIARTSVMHYKRGQMQIDQIGRELGVQYVLEGSVRRDAGKVRISAQLIQMKDQTHVWARQYDRDLSHLLALQGEIAQEIAGEIKLTLGDRNRVTAESSPAGSPSSYEAYDLYLKGRYFWNKRTKEGFQQAAEYFQQAIEKDPHYAGAYAGLADTFALMSSWSYFPQNEFIPKARAAAMTAVQMDDRLAEAHTSLALIAQNYDYDWKTAEKEYRRAIQLDPGYATAHQWYAESLSFQGRFEEALAESRRARLLDPLSLIIATDHGVILYFSRQYDRAIEQFRSVLAMEPSFARARIVTYAYVEKGMFAEALAETEKWHHEDGTPVWEMQAYVYGRSGQLVQAGRALAKWEKWNGRGRPELTSTLLMTYVATGNQEKAIALLQKASFDHSNVVIPMKVEPGFDALRSDPRFQDILQRVGLADAGRNVARTARP